MDSRLAYVVLVVVLVWPCSPAVGQTDTTEANAVQSTFDMLNRAAQDTAVQRRATDGAVDFIRRLGQLKDSSEAARERIPQMQSEVGPDSINALVEMMQRRSAEALNELQSAFGHLYATSLRELDAPATRERVGPLRVAATGLPLPFGYAVDLTKSGELLMTGTYMRQVVLGDAYRTTVEGETITQMRELSRSLSPGRAGWVYELDAEGAMSGISIEASGDGGAYVLARASAGPSTIAGRTFQHGQDSTLTALIRVGTDGQPQWAAPIARRSVSWTGALADDGDGGVVVAYGLNESIAFTAASNTSSEPATAPPTFAGEHDADQYLARFDADGSLRWRSVIDNITIRSLVTGDDGTMYAAGQVNGSSPFCGGIQMDADAQAAFAARIDSDGTCQWIQASSASMPLDPEPGVARYVPADGNALHAVALDSDGDAYVTGAFLREMTFAGRSLRGNAPEGTGVIAKLDGETGSMRWVTVRDVDESALITGARDSRRGRVFGYSLAADDEGAYVIESRMEKPPVADGATSLFWIIRVGAEGQVEWEEPTNLIAGLSEDASLSRRVKLLSAPSGPAYVAMQARAVRVAGRDVRPPDDVQYLFVGRLGSGASSSDNPMNRLRQLMEGGGN
jgi:hypothetical protein